MLKTGELFYGESNSKPGEVGVWSHKAVIFNDSPGKRLTYHGKSENYKDVITV